MTSKRYVIVSQAQHYLLFWSRDAKYSHWATCFSEAKIFDSKPDLHKILKTQYNFVDDLADRFIKRNNVSVIRAELIPFL